MKHCVYCGREMHKPSSRGYDWFAKRKYCCIEHYHLHRADVPYEPPPPKVMTQQDVLAEMDFAWFIVRSLINHKHQQEMIEIGG